MKLEKVRIFYLDNTVVDIELRQVRVTDLYGLDFGPGHTMQSFVYLISALADLTVEEVEEFQVASINKLSEVITGMMAGGPAHLGIIK